METRTPHRPRLGPWSLVPILFAAGAAAPATAQGLRAGDKASSFTLTDVHGKRYTLDSFRKKRILEFWYEGQQSRKQNLWLKNRIRRLRKRRRITNHHFRSVGIANYRESPVPNFIIDLAIKQIIKREPYLVLCDRDGRMQRRWGFRNGRSNIYLFNRERRLLWKSSGPLTRKRARQYMRLLVRLTR